MDKQYTCCVTGSVVPVERAEFLINMGIPEDELTVVSVSPIQRIKLPSNKCDFDSLTEAGKILEEKLRDSEIEEPLIVKEL